MYERRSRANGGRRFMDAIGSIDKLAMGRKVFFVQERDWFESLLHPHYSIQLARVHSIMSLKKCMIIELPLLFENNLQNNFTMYSLPLRPKTSDFKRLQDRGLTNKESECSHRQPTIYIRKDATSRFCLWVGGFAFSETAN